jgi:hypothetical protein
LHGSSITKGYLDNPEANAPPRLLRMGGFGQAISDSLIATVSCTLPAEPRKSSCSAAEKSDPRRSRADLWQRARKAEIAVLEDKGVMVALVRPDCWRGLGLAAPTLPGLDARSGYRSQPRFEHGLFCLDGAGDLTGGPAEDPSVGRGYRCDCNYPRSVTPFDRAPDRGTSRPAMRWSGSPKAGARPTDACSAFCLVSVQLLLRTEAPAVPAYIAGTFEAWPRGRRIPTLHRVTVTFGHPAPVVSLRGSGTGRTDEERAANVLRQRLLALHAEADGTAKPVAEGDHAAAPVGDTHQ